MSLPLSTNDLTLVKLKECGHFLLSEKPEEVIDEIIRFLA
ncbi:alpha/beta hydrolase [Myroides albus]|nr:alpha/beta hydrolase [Myroides albus]UVD78732.1 alpha/beta hydrolase [Myroides albus]